MARKQRLVTRPGGVELRDGLPRYDEDWVKFLVERLPDYQPCSVPEFMEAIGFEARPRGTPCSLYQRFLREFERGKDEGKLAQVPNRRDWRVAERQSKAS